MIVDLFAGGGGASLGIERALGRSPDVAINHDAAALSMHASNHPRTVHLCGDVWSYAPREVTHGKPVELLWASPTCTHFSQARGAALDRSEALKVRSLAWVVIRWAREASPEWIFVENVRQFESWCRLRSDGTPDPRRKGETFRRWVRKLELLGYRVEWRRLRACDFGAPTTRERLFIVARRDGGAIVWPTPTHGRGLTPYRSAGECIDWTLPTTSIFDRSKPLVEASLRRIARGVQRFVIDAAHPYLVPGGAAALVHQGNGERKGQAPRVYDIAEPLGTVVAGGVKQRLVVALLAKHFGGHESPGQSLQLPLGTVTTQDHHHLVEVELGDDLSEDVAAFLTRYNGVGLGQSLRLPLGTVTTKDRFALVTVHRQAYRIVDIRTRMLVPRELFRAQGFHDGYRIDPPRSTKAQVRMAGNSVSPDPAEALIRANLLQAREERAA